MKKTLLFLIPLMVLGLLVRLWHNTQVALWHDEAFSALLIKYPWQEMFYRIGLDVHPPAYYIALRLWSYIFNDSLLSLRGFSIMFGVLTIPASYLLARDVFNNKWVGIITATFVTFNPFQVQYVTEARMYTFGAFFALISAWCLVSALQKEKQSYTDGIPNKHVLWYYLGFTLATIIIIYTHYYLLFTAAALGFTALLHHLWFYRTQFRKYVVLFGSFFLIGLSYVPWLKTLFFQVGQVSAGYWIPPINKWSMPEIVWRLLTNFGVDVNATKSEWTIVIATIIVLALIVWLIYKASEFEKWVLVLPFLAPFGGSILFFLKEWLKCHPLLKPALVNCQINSVLQDRYFLFASTFLLIIIAWFIARQKKPIAITVTILFAVFSFYSISYFWNNNDINHKEGMAGIAKVLHANAKPTDKVIAGTSYILFNLRYYARQQNTHFPDPSLYTGGRRDIKQISHVEGVALLTNNDLTADFAKDVTPGTTVWLVWTNGFGSKKPDLPITWQEGIKYGFSEMHPWPGAWVEVDKYIAY